MDRLDDTEDATRRDPLTGLFNRDELERLHLSGTEEPVGVVYFDINDLRNYGSSRKGEVPFVGDDRTIKDFAKRLLRAALPGTVVVRLESSHFIAVVTGASIREATAAQLVAFRQEFTTPSDTNSVTAGVNVGMGTAEVESTTDIYRCMKLAHDAYYNLN